MARRITVEVVLILVLTVLLAWSIVGAVSLADTTDPVGVLVDQTPRVLFGLLGIGIGLWVVLLIIGAIAYRRRPAGWRVATHLFSLLVALAVNIGVFALLNVAAGGSGGDDWGMLVVTIAAAAAVAVFVSGVIVVLVVEFLVLPKLGEPANT